MTKTFTQNDVLRFFYNEVTESEKNEIEKTLLWDDSLAEFYAELLEMETLLDKIKKEPSDNCIRNILNYSKSVSVHSV